MASAAILSTGSRLPATALPQNPPAGSARAKAKDAAQTFESVVLQTMMQQMMTSTGEDGPLGGGAAGGAWRGLLVQDYAETMSKAGGIGIASSVYRDILALQEGSGKERSTRPGSAGAASALTTTPSTTTAATALDAARSALTARTQP